MLALAGILFVALSAATFLVRVRLGLFSRYPYEQFVLVGVAFVLGLLAAVAEPGALTLGLLLVDTVALALVVWFLGFGSRFPEDAVAVRPGERFPDFELPDSEGGKFASSSLRGIAPALYVFYRGHF